MGLDLNSSNETENSPNGTMNRNSEVQKLDQQQIDAVCANLCKLLDHEVAQDIAYAKAFGFMSRFADMIDQVSFHLGFDNLKLSTIPLPFEIGDQQPVIMLTDFDKSAELTTYSTAKEIFVQRWRPSRESFLIVAENLTWALMINDSGGITYWKKNETQDLSELSIPNIPIEGC